jgi:uncharacterized phiE125 gp8 family phage protein
MALRLITPPTVEPLTLAEVKAHLRVDHTDEDSIIALYLQAARMNLEGPEGFLGRAIVTQVWELVIDAFPESEIKIPLPPLQTVDSIRYDDPAGDEQIVDTTDYWVDNVSEPGWVVPTTMWPTPLDAVNAVRIRFTAGYPPDTASPPDLTTNIPFDIKAGILLHVGSMYEHREQVVVGVAATSLPWGAENLLRPRRVQIGMA